MLACSADPDDVLLIWDIDGALTLELEEVILDDRSHLRFDLITEDFTFCQGATIIQRVNIDNRVMDVRIVGVSQGDGCDDPEDQATSELSLDEIEDGNYNIQLNLSNRQTINGLLAINEDDYQIDFRGNENIILPNSRLQKTPLNLVVAFFEWENGTNADAINNFFDVRRKKLN